MHELNICTLNELRPKSLFGVMHFMHAKCMAALVALGMDIKVSYARTSVEFSMSGWAH